jgi:hypothetical protein
LILALLTILGGSLNAIPGFTAALAMGPIAALIGVLGTEPAE